MPTKHKTKSVPSSMLHSRNSPLRLVPHTLNFCAFLVAFTLPNLVFSGSFFFSTLHLMKWTTVFVPIAILGIVSGYRAARYGTNITGYRIDGFAVLWFLLIVYVTLQPFWTDVRSMVTFYQEWFFFAALWLVYVLASLQLDGKLLRTLLWGALLNAAINVFFAELQIRGLASSFPFIAPASAGNYIGNTGQQNMFALWMAISGLGGVFLLFSTPPSKDIPTRKLLITALVSVVFWGLVASTSRSGIMSFWVGFFVLSLFYLRVEGRGALRKIAFGALLFSTVLTINLSYNPSRTEVLLDKMEDIVQKPLSIANRNSIWATSWTMFTERPWRGTGLGQFKWNYIDANNLAMRRGLHTDPHATHWAHNEFLQWMAEGGIGGTLLMFSLWIWWAVSAGNAFFRRTRLSPETIWGSSLVAAFLFSALWTRPFHRIENAVWLALAFAAANRELLLPLFPSPSPKRIEKWRRLLAATTCLVSLAGLLYLGDGIRGDRLLRLALGRAGGDAAAVRDLLGRAHSSLMVRDLAEKNLASFSIELGKSVGNFDMIADGLNLLTSHFQKQPHPEDLAVLLDWAYSVHNMEFRRYIESFVYRPSPDAEPGARVSAESE